MKERIWQAAQEREGALVGFLQALVRIPSPSGQERQVAARIAQQMESLGYDEVRIDALGNVVGRVGCGPRVVAMDGHVDTVVPTAARAWSYDPHSGEVSDGQLYGCGSVDQKGGVAGLVYGGAMAKQLGLLDGVTLYVVGSVQEEDCDGLCWQYILHERGIVPDCIVLSEPTNLAVHLGHRGRVEIAVTVRGKAAHASAPGRGRNAVYAMGRILGAIERLNGHLPSDDVLGSGSVAVTDVRCTAPSLCSIPDECTIVLDRRITRQDTRSSVVDEVRRAIEQVGEHAEVDVPRYDVPSYRGIRFPAERFFPAWALDADSGAAAAGREAYETLFDEAPRLGYWVFSTNGVATMGLHGIPTIGFGPGDERWAHAVDEHVPVDHLVRAAAWYAAFPSCYARRNAVAAPKKRSKSQPGVTSRGG